MLVNYTSINSHNSPPDLQQRRSAGSSKIERGLARTLTFRARASTSLARNRIEVVTPSLLHCFITTASDFTTSKRRILLISDFSITITSFDRKLHRSPDVF